jgi:hypothetical protein
VVGLPEPRSNHAIVMVKFANDILVEMSVIVSALETRLGPGTANLRIRVGVSIYFGSISVSYPLFSNNFLSSFS